ncbi:acyltransferase family protein [Cupriavidus sp. BIS7]|uniref:acyltransferase family protein n=1 Tax=Cupriavidus sp. BIS7 TaxID=1217718 RepID=UPI00030AA61E|nr:acyltransferase family protein [Cupriavidus sp. BIS7]
MKYRADIDGLRAIAVLSVLFFHAGFQAFSGGYIGVDVFFVISGYLITRMIRDQVAAGTFSFGNFYLRRARRLFPAMLATYLLTAVSAIVLFAPQYLERFGGEMIHAMASISNFYFWLEADYFDAGAKLKPLLHTWSLSVEEQFYLIWPLMLVLAMRGRKWLAPAILISVSVASLLANDAAAGNQAVVAKDFGNTGLGQFLASTDLPGGKAAMYFLLPFRVFEFGFGGILVWLERFLEPKRKMVLDVVMLIGLVLVGYGIFTFNDHTLFPWLNAIPPCLGTTLLIYAGRDSRIGRIVGLASGVGKISYSVYLVHWPIIVFTEYWLIDPPSTNTKIAMCAASIAAGWLIYRVIETPFRHAKATVKPMPGMVSASDVTFALTMFVSAAVVFIAGSSIWKFDGWKWRVDPKYAYSASEFHLKFWGGAGYPTNEFVQFGAASKQQFLMFGDSFAMQYAKAIDGMSAAGNVGFNVLFHQGCMILPNAVRLRDGVEDKSCSVEYQKIKQALAANPAKDVLIAFNWAGYKDLLARRDGKPLKFERDVDYYAFLAKEIRVIAADGGSQRRYFIIGSPNPSFNAITCLGSSALIPRQCKESIDRHDQAVNKALMAIAKSGSNIYFIDPNTALCDKEKCVAIKNGEPVYSDGAHLSFAGTEIVVPYMVYQVTHVNVEGPALQALPDAGPGTSPAAEGQAQTGGDQRA